MRAASTEPLSDAACVGDVVTFPFSSAERDTAAEKSEFAFISCSPESDVKRAYPRPFPDTETGVDVGSDL